jgi:hypothetical protein
MTDEERLNWVIERLTLERPMLALALLGLPSDALEGTARETIGDRFREAVDREIARGK